MTRFPLWGLLGAALALLPAGCAKSPSAASSGNPGGAITGKLLVITMTVRGQLDLANDYYYVAFNVNGNTRNGFTGPVPVVTDFERGGNGFAGGAFSTFIECHQNEPNSSNFGIFGTDMNLLARNYIAKPIQESVNGSTFQIQIPLANIASAYANQTGTSFTESQITNLQVNFINTNVVPTNPQDTTTKYFDALGDPSQGQLNAYVTIPTGTDTTYMNGTFNSEPPDDVATYATTTTGSTTSTTQTDYSNSVQIVPDQTPASIAALDITNWSIEIRG